MSVRKVMVVDGSSLLFRTYHGFEERKAPDGRDVRVVYGTLKMIMDFAKFLRPNHIVVVFDAPGGSFERKALYPDYKAHRPERPDEIIRQEPLIRRFLKAGGAPVLSVVGVEADDVMATISKEGSALGWHIGNVTPDKDCAQMVKKHVSIFKTEKDASGRKQIVRMGEKDVLAKFGIRPSQVIDFLTLVGDTADNVPGVDKVGPKTAVEWLNKYGSLEGIIAHATEIPGLAGENLRQSISMLPTVRELIRLRDDIPLPEWKEFAESDEDLLREIREELGLPSWMGSLKEWCRRQD